jgi:hypothetical protein
MLEFSSEARWDGGWWVWCGEMRVTAGTRCGRRRGTRRGRCSNRVRRLGPEPGSTTTRSEEVSRGSRAVQCSAVFSSRREGVSRRAPVGRGGGSLLDGAGVVQAVSLWQHAAGSPDCLEGRGQDNLHRERVRTERRSRSVWSAAKRFLMRQNGSVGRQRDGQTR